MEVDLIFVRVYGSNSQYGEYPRTSPIEEPLIIENFPIKEDKVIIYLGEPSECVFNANRLRIAQGMYQLYLRSNSRNDLPIDDCIDSFLERIDTYPQIDDYGWYVTIIIKRKVTIPNKYITDEKVSKYLWVSPKYLEEINNKFEPYCSDNINKLVLYLSTIIGSEFFENIIIDNTFVTKNENEPQGLPRHNLSITVDSIRTMESLNISDLKNGLNLISSDKSKISWLKDVFDLRLFAIQEKDPLKKFIWNFTFLESIIYKLYDKYYQDIISKLTLELDSGKKTLNFEEIIGCNIDGLKKMDLKGKFVIVGLKAFPDDLEAEIESFSEVKKIRNDLAHGRIKKLEDLPNNKLEQIVKKILNESITISLKE